MRPLIVSAALALLVSSCRETPPDVVTARDSAGVRIVEIPAAPTSRDSAWTIGPEATLDLGGADVRGEEQFSDVAGAVRLSDGRIVVADGGSRQLRYFDRSGRFLMAVGRQGAGPGEFEGIGSLVRLPEDSVAIWDWGLTRLSVFDEGGTFIRSVAISYASRPPQLAGYLGDGTWLFTTDFSFGPGETSRVVRDTTPYLRFDADGTLLDTLLTSPAAEYFVQGTSQFAMGSRLLFGRGHAWATFAGGFYACRH